MSLRTRFKLFLRRRAQYRMAVETSAPVQTIRPIPTKPAVYCDPVIKTEPDSIVSKLRLVGGL